jgi:hypothetical protein
MILLFPITDNFRGTRSMVRFAGATYTFDAAVDYWPASREGGT